MKNILFKGSPLTLVGRDLQKGFPAPDFKVISFDLSDVGLSDFSQKVKVITTFPSLDTPVCDLQLKEFNKRASQVSDEVAILAISKDLPFAQKRFCETNNIKNLSVLSDYKSNFFGINYGLLIKELTLLARSVFILDKNNILRYFQVVEELTNPPDYDNVIVNIEEVLSKPDLFLGQDVPLRCRSCEGGVASLSEERIKELAVKHNGWEVVDGKKIKREFRFANFPDAKHFVDLVSIVSETEGHHPTIVLAYNVVKITFTTHVSGGLTENDFIMAEIIDNLKGAG